MGQGQAYHHCMQGASKIDLMNLLAIDTSTLQGAIAILRSDGERFAATTDPSRRHGRDLVPAIRDLLASASLKLADIQAFGVGLGPGSYTGLRVGVMAAKTLAYATSAKLLGLDSLEFFARSLSGEASLITVISDAQRGDFHVADFHRNSDLETPRRIGETRIESQDALIAAWTEARRVTGPGLVKWHGDWPSGIVPDLAQTPPDPAILVDLLADAIEREQDVQGWTLEPIYLRRSAAEDLWDKRR